MITYADIDAMNGTDYIYPVETSSTTPKGHVTNNAEINVPQATQFNGVPVL